MKLHDDQKVTTKKDKYCFRTFHGADCLMVRCGWVRFLPNRISPREFAFGITAPKRSIGFSKIMFGPNRTARGQTLIRVFKTKNFATVRVRCGAICNGFYRITPPHRTIFAFDKTASNRTVPLSITKIRTAPHRGIPQIEKPHPDSVLRREKALKCSSIDRPLRQKKKNSRMTQTPHDDVTPTACCALALLASYFPLHIQSCTGIIFVLYFSGSLPFVTQIRGHIIASGYSSRLSPLRCVPSILYREKKSSAVSSLVDLRRIARTHFLQANFCTRKRAHSVGIELAKSAFLLIVDSSYEVKALPVDHRGHRDG